jgi:hypothetical protein
MHAKKISVLLRGNYFYPHFNASLKKEMTRNFVLFRFLTHEFIYFPINSLFIFYISFRFLFKTSFNRIKILKNLFINKKSK